MYYKIITGTFVSLLCFCLAAVAQLPKPTDTLAKPKTPTDGIKSFQAFFKDKVLSDTGMFISHQSQQGHFFEIPDSLLKRDMLMVSTRVAMSSSDIEQTVAGERVQPGLMLQWDKSPDGKFIFLRKVTSRVAMRFTGLDTGFKNALALQTLDPVLMSFPIKAKGERGSNSIVDIQPFFIADIKDISPFGQHPIQQAMGIPAKKYKVETDRSYIERVQSFDKNVEVRSFITFTNADNIYSIVVNRSMILLPEQPMMGRYADDRVGYFTKTFTTFNESEAIGTKAFISRWRLEPKPEHVERMKNGELVEPAKPIVFYLDASTPQKWKEYIKKGVEDWLPAFEAAGFKNAIVAKDVPQNDPHFNPEDIRYSVIRYTASAIPNAKGPSVTDPRSGEILESDVIIYHNIIQILSQWRFAQTAANDPSVRSGKLSDEVLGEAIRYVSAHEIGHALGLRHNMGASAAFPVDSLRSASFTQKYGTTPSIMDYARNNYVAQPEDKGVKLTPPLLGVYDKYAINWGYRPIAASTPDQETQPLNAWIMKHAGDPKYRFAEGDVNASDPSSLKESLGDDVIKASRYGVMNTRYILNNMRNWMNQPGEKYDDLEDYFVAVLKQYERYLGHVSTLIGGSYQYYPVQGQPQATYRFTSKKENQEAVAFMLEQYHQLPLWLSALPKDMIIYEKAGAAKRIVTTSTYVERLVKKSFQAELLNVGKLVHLTNNGLHQQNGYSSADLLNDIRKDVFAESRKSPNYYDQMIQSIYVDRLINLSALKKTVGNAKAVQSDVVDHDCFQLFDNAAGEEQLYFQFMDLVGTDKQFKIESLAIGELTKIKAIAEQRIATTQSDIADHYRYLVKKIGLVLQ